jgi:hypothetical protein
VREVEAQLAGQPRRLLHRVGVVGEPRGHGLRRGEHVRVVAAAQRLGGVEGRVLADSHERVLQARALAGVGVDVARGDGAQPPPRRDAGQLAVDRAVVAPERPLQLDAQALAPEGPHEPPQGAVVAHAALGTAREADEPGRVLLDVAERDRGGDDVAPARRVARVGVGAREQPAQARPPRRIADEQREVPCRRARRGRRAVGADVDLRPVDGPQPRALAAWANSIDPETEL